MGELKSILVTLNLSEDHWVRLENNLVGTKIIRVNHSDKDAIGNALKEVDAALIQGNIDERYLQANNLKWVHIDAAGLNSVAKPELFKANLLVTGSAGRSAPALAEHAIFFMLSFAYNVHEIFKSQKNHQWGYKGQENTKALFNQTIGIIGLGSTGIALAERAKALEMRVIAHKRHTCEKPLYVDVMCFADQGQGLDELLKESDFIVLAVPLTDKTYNLIGEREIELMKPNAVIVNMARGEVINEAALIKALNSGRIAGAGLDTFCQEPLPKDSPIWDTPNLIATPHFTPPCPDKIGRSLDIMIENIERFRSGRELKNLLKPEDVFTQK